MAYRKQTELKKMNPHILFVIDHQLNPGKYTKKQLEDNTLAAAYADDAYDAYDADASYRAAAADAAAAAAADINTEYWIDDYFKRSGENKDDYIMELNK